MNRNSTFLTMMTMNVDKLSSVKNNHQLKMKCRLLEMSHKPLMPNDNQLITQLSEIYGEYC
jgi:hypothetical protein